MKRASAICGSQEISRLLGYVATGKSPLDKLKILTMHLLIYLQYLSPPPAKGVFDRIARGTTIQTELKFTLGTPYNLCVFSPSWEKGLEDAFDLKKGVCFLDVGANVGKYTLRAAILVGESGKVIAVEPNKGNFRVLVKNIELNKLQNCIPFNIAASSTDGEVTLFLGPNSAEHSIVQDFGRGSYRIRARALDKVLNETGIEKVDIIKIDVEGAELEVLEGLNMTLKKENPLIVIEIHPLKNKYKIVEYLNNLGYVEELLDSGLHIKGGIAHYRFRKENGLFSEQSGMRANSVEVKA
jgi:FkbM family methyltransferase